MPPTADISSFTDEQKRLFNNAASLGSGVQTNPYSINSSVMSQAPAINYTQPTITSTYPVAGLNAPDPLQLTGQEQKQSEIGTRLQDLQNQLVGESQARGQLETQAGLPELQKTQNDLTSRLGALKNEAMAIPLQLQQDATGRGITAGGLQPIQTAALRNNAIQALSTSSLLEASRGNLTLAQDQVDRAVAQRFDPIREQIKAAQANLELIINDPLTSLQDKNRALAQKAQQDAKALETEKKREIETAKGKAVLEYAGIADARTLQAMQNAPDAVAVLQIAAQNGLVTPEQAKAKLQEELIQSQIRENETQIQNIRNQITNRNSSPGGASTVNGKPQNTSQAKANGYADRLVNANTIISNLGGLFTGRFAFGGSLPNSLQSANRQSYEQAKRDFINAVLRNESGAAIAQSEFDSAEKQYFPLAGDSQAVVAQKLQSRNTAINNFYREANAARPVLPGDIVEFEGKRAKIDADGVTLLDPDTNKPLE